MSMPKFIAEQGKLLLGIGIGAFLMVIGVALGAQYSKGTEHVVTASPLATNSVTSPSSIEDTSAPATPKTTSGTATAKSVSPTSYPPLSKYPCSTALASIDGLYKSNMSLHTQEVNGKVELTRLGAHSQSEAGRPPAEFIAAINSYYQSGNANLNADYQLYLGGLKKYGDISQPCNLDMGPPTLFPESFTGTL